MSFASLARIARQAVVDAGRRDGGVSFRDAELMQVGNDITGGVKSFDAGLLLVIDLDQPDLVAARPERAREFRVHVAAEHRIEHIEFMRAAVRECDLHACLGLPE